MAANDAKSLAYTTPLLAEDIVVAGHPILHLWLATEAADLDAFAYLEETNGNGKSTYITEGNLRASHRKLSDAHFDNLGLPYHAQCKPMQQRFVRMNRSNWCLIFCRPHTGFTRGAA
jgi:predicted acyl esterase